MMTKPDPGAGLIGMQTAAPSTRWATMVAQAVLHSIFVLGLMKTVLLDPLRLSKIDMAHLDPTEIIATPYPLSRLGLFVGVSVSVLFLTTVPWWELRILAQYLSTLVAVSVVLLGTFVLCGAHPFHNIYHTVLTSLYVACLISWEPTQTKRYDTIISRWLSRLRGLTEPTTRHDKLVTAQFHGTMLGMIPFQILHILDWGAQVQRWPIPIVLGSTTGWVVGTGAGLLWTVCTEDTLKVSSARHLE